MSLDPEVPAGLEGPVTTAVTRRVKPGHEAASEAFPAGINNADRAFPDYLGVEVFPPPPGRRRVPLRGSIVTKGRNP